MADSDTRKPKLALETWVSLGLLVMTVGGAISLTAYLTSMSKDLGILVAQSRDMSNWRIDVSASLASLTRDNEDAVKRMDWMEWVGALQRSNPTMTIPPPVRSGLTDDRK